MKLRISVCNYNDETVAILKSSQESNIVGEIYNPILIEDATGQFEFNFILPLTVVVNGLEEDNYRWNYMISEYKVKVEYDTSVHWFKIKSTNDQHDGSGSLSSNVQCKSLAYDLNKKNTEMTVEKTDTALNLVTHVLNNTGWIVGTVDSFDNKTLSLIQTSPSNALNLLNEIAILFDGRLVFDTDAKTVSLYSNANLNDSEIDFRIGKNIKSLNRTVTSDDIVTRLYVNGGEIDTGTVGIQTINPTGEPYIDNFSYYILNGMLTPEQEALIDPYNLEMRNFNISLGIYNNEISNLNSIINSIDVDLTTANFQRTSKLETISKIDGFLAIETNPTKIATYNQQRANLIMEINGLDGQITSWNGEKTYYNGLLQTATNNYNSNYANKQSAKNAFYNAFSDFIQEGIYTNSNLIEPQSIYDDGIKVLADLCLPKTSYTINILDLSLLTGYELEKFKLYDKVNVFDPFLNIKTKVKITKIQRNLMELQNSTIEIANFYTPLEELLRDFARNVQLIKNQKRYWDRTQGTINPDGTINNETLEDSINNGGVTIERGNINGLDTELWQIGDTFLTNDALYSGFISGVFDAAAQAQETADGQIQGFFQIAAPTEGMSFGDIWIDTDGHNPPTVADIYRYEDSTHGSRGADLDWRPTPTNAVGKVYLDAYNAQTMAESKITTFFQNKDNPPTALAIGDLWVITDDKNKIYRATSIGADEIKTDEWILVNAGIQENTFYNQVKITTDNGVQVLDLAARERVKIGQFVNSSSATVYGMLLKNALGATQFEVDSDGNAIFAGSIKIGTNGNGTVDVGNGMFTVATDGTVNIKKGSLNIANNFIVDQLGNVTANGNFNLLGNIRMGGNITWDTPVVQYQYSTNNSSWHTAFATGDKYRRESWDGGTTWQAGYQFIGVDGLPGSDGSDANVPDYITATYIDFNSVSSPYIRGNNIAVQGGSFIVKDLGGTTTYGYMGYGEGNNGVSTTTGVILSSANSGSIGLTKGDYYFIATDSGVRMQGGNYSIYCTASGAHWSDGITEYDIGGSGTAIAVFA